MSTDHVDRILAQWAVERPDLDSSPVGVIGRLSRAARFIDRELDRVFREHGLDGAGYDVLASLRRSGPPYTLSASALAATTMVARSSMTSRVDRLETAGLVARAPDAHDGRGVAVSLTPAGHELVDRVIVDHLANEERLLAALPPGSRERLADDLRALLVTLE